MIQSVFTLLLKYRLENVEGDQIQQLFFIADLQCLTNKVNKK